MSALDEWTKNHRPNCILNEMTGAIRCSCGRDEAQAELAQLRTELDKALETMIVARDTGDFLLINQYIRHKAGDE